MTRQCDAITGLVSRMVSIRTQLKWNVRRIETHYYTLPKARWKVIDFHFKTKMWCHKLSEDNHTIPEMWSIGIHQLRLSSTNREYRLQPSIHRACSRSGLKSGNRAMTDTNITPIVLRSPRGFITSHLRRAGYKKKTLAQMGAEANTMTTIPWPLWKAWDPVRFWWA